MIKEESGVGMQAKVDVEKDVSVVRLSGYLDFETVLPFRRDCLNHISTPKIVFDFKDLNFVGSCGLTSFLQTLLDFCEAQTRRPRFANVSIEYKRLMRAADFLESDFHDTVDVALGSFVFSDAAANVIDPDLRRAVPVAGNIDDSAASESSAGSAIEEFRPFDIETDGK